MVLTCYNDKWKYCLTIRIDILDHNNPFPIIKLYNFNFFTPVIEYYNKNGYNLVYKKVCFVEIPNIGFHNIIFSNYILEKLKLSFNDL